MKNRAVSSLPENYSFLRRLDINEGRNLLHLTVLSGILLVVSWAGYSLLANALHPGSLRIEMSISNAGLLRALAFIGRLVVISAVMLVIHEGLHGLCFLLFTGKIPRFAFKGAYAYAAAPDWYLPRGQYLVTGLAPLVMMTIFFSALMFVLSAPWMPWLAWMLILNISGSAGDLWMVWELLHSPADLLARDKGDLLEIFSEVL